MNTKTMLGASIAALTLAIAATPLASAQNLSEGGKPRGGKEITLDRLLYGAERMFNFVDADSDGLVSESEAAAMADAKGQKAKDKIAAGKDKRGEGKRAMKGGKKGGLPLIKAFIGEDGLTAGMTWEAVQAKVSDAFGDWDADGSGSLSREEVMPLMKELRGKFGPRSDS